VVLLSPSKKIPEVYLKLDHDHFLPHLFQFIIHLLSFHSTLLSWLVKKRRYVKYK
jgi:hypothetical protein